MQGGPKTFFTTLSYYDSKVDKLNDQEVSKMESCSVHSLQLKQEVTVRSTELPQAACTLLGK